MLRSARSRGSVTIRWCLLAADDRSSFVYSPRFGRTYVLPDDIMVGRFLPKLLGLRAANRAPELPDPASSVQPAGNEARVSEPSPFLVFVYRFLHRYRSIASVSRVLLLARLAARFQRRRSWSIGDIGATVLSVERAAGLSDCYPRSLITAYLCMRSRRDCSLAIGMLAPTPNMHAWCAAERVVPFEPDPSHWWYRPLAIIDITW